MDKLFNLNRPLSHQQNNNNYGYFTHILGELSQVTHNILKYYFK